MAYACWPRPGSRWSGRSARWRCWLPTRGWCAAPWNWRRAVAAGSRRGRRWMRWREAWTPEPMSRVAVVAPVPALRDALVRVADAGTVELDKPAATADRAPDPGARLSPSTPDTAALEEAGRTDLLAGEAQLRGYADRAVVRDEVAALLGWIPTGQL